MPEAPLESVKKTTPIIVEEPLSSFSLKTFGKVKTTVDILLEKKELAKVQRALKEQAENNHPVENKPVQNVTQKAKPNLGKVVTTVETLIKDKKIKTSENKNFNKLSPTPAEEEPQKKEDPRLAWLKAIEKAPPGTIIVGLKDVKTKNQQQTMQKADFTKPKKKRIDKNKFKKDLEIEETKELKITMYDLLDKDKK